MILRFFSICTLTAVAVFLSVLLSAFPALAHEVRPALLDIRETQAGWYEVTWKVPIFEGAPLDIQPVYPEGFDRVSPPSVQELPAARIEKSSYRDETETLVGGTIFIDGLAATQVDVLIQIMLADGTSHSAIVKPKEPSWELPATPDGWDVAKSYWIMGIEHILSGLDHLLFVFALILLIPGTWMLVKAITAFTLAHTLTLGLATFGFVNMPPGPTEAAIALSIVFLAVEIVRSRAGQGSIASRSPWLVAFLFGLFHGLGFAGALNDIGLPQNAIPLALFMFNVGVETGQLMFVAAILIAIWSIRYVRIPGLVHGWRVVTYGIGTLAAYWTIDRAGSFLWAAS